MAGPLDESGGPVGCATPDSADSHPPRRIAGSVSPQSGRLFPSCATPATTAAPSMPQTKQSRGTLPDLPYRIALEPECHSSALFGLHIETRSSSRCPKTPFSYWALTGVAYLQPSQHQPAH
jgi:hypothetical protein